MSSLAARRCISLNVFFPSVFHITWRTNFSPAFSCPVLQFSGNVSVPRKACGLAQVNGRVILQYWCPTPAVLILLTCPKKLSSSSDAEIQSIPLHTALTRSSAIAEGPRDAPCHKNRNVAQMCVELHLISPALGE